MSENKETIPMRERVKEYVPITAVAETFGISRPTLYMLMQSYDEGRTSDMECKLKDFFDLVASDPEPEEVKVFLKVKGVLSAAHREYTLKKSIHPGGEMEALNREIDSMRVMISNLDADMANTIRHHAELCRELAMVRNMIANNPDDNAEYRMRAENLSMRISSIDSDIDGLRTQMAKARTELESLEDRRMGMMSRGVRRKDGVKEWTEDGRLRTLSIGDAGRTMVLFRLIQADDTLDEPEFAVYLYIDTPEGDLMIGKYLPEEDKNFVTIDDVLPGLNPRYEVECQLEHQYMKSERYPLNFR